MDELAGLTTPFPPGLCRRKERLTMMTPVSLFASMMVTRHVAGRTAARMSSASACPFTVDTGTKVTAEHKTQVPRLGTLPFQFTLIQLHKRIFHDDKRNLL